MRILSNRGNGTTENEDVSIIRAVAQVVAWEERKKLSLLLPPPRIPTAEDLARRQRHAAATEQLRTRLGKIDIPASELVRLGRERADGA